MLKSLHLVVKTRESAYAGTQNRPVLILGDQTRDLVHHTFEVPEGGFPAGQAAYFALPVEDLNLPNYFNSFRLGLRGSDLWQLDYAFLWAETQPEVYDQYSVQPLAFAPVPLPDLSTDAQEGRISVPLPVCYLGGFYTEIQEILVVIRNSQKRNAGTKSPVSLSITTSKGLALDTVLNPDGITGMGESMIQQVTPLQTFFYNQLRSIELRIQGDDQWQPEQVFVLGITSYGETRHMTPMVYIPHWTTLGLPKMSMDPEEGVSSVMLYQAFL